MTDEAKVNAALKQLNDARAEAEEDEYDFFFQAPIETQREFYQYWLKAHATDGKQMPRFLKDFELKNTG